MLGLRKRKIIEETEDEDGTSGIAGDLKRVKITTTAGEIRLQKDIEELRGCTGVYILRGNLPNSAIIEFDPISVVHYQDNHNIATPSPSPALQQSQHLQQQSLTNQSHLSNRHQLNSLPTRFIVTVLRYYPHSAPHVRCLDAHITCPPHIDTDGTIHHIDLERGWSPIKSLRDVVQILYELRMFHASSNNYSPINYSHQYHNISNNSQNMHEHYPPSPAAHDNYNRSNTVGLSTPRGVEGMLNLTLADETRVTANNTQHFHQHNGHAMPVPPPLPSPLHAFSQHQNNRMLMNTSPSGTLIQEHRNTSGANIQDTDVSMMMDDI